MTQRGENRSENRQRLAEIVEVVRKHEIVRGGITPEKLAELEARFSASEYDTSEHLGLVNISARLRLQYGDAAGLHITGAPGDGTCVSICIPLSKRPGKE